MPTLCSYVRWHAYIFNTSLVTIERKQNLGCIIYTNERVPHNSMKSTPPKCPNEIDAWKCDRIDIILHLLHSMVTFNCLGHYSLPYSRSFHWVCALFLLLIRLKTETHTTTVFRLGWWKCDHAIKLTPAVMMPTASSYISTARQRTKVHEERK